MSRAKALFLAALDCDEERREEFVLESCADEPELAGRVRELIAAHVEANERLPDIGELGRRSRSESSREELARQLREEMKRLSRRG